MASLDEERYLRHIWLLGEGGLFVLRRVVSREAAKSGNTLESLLQNGRGRFKDVLQEQQNCLFPTPTTINANVNTWDMSLLFVVLKKLFWSGLLLSERANLSALKTYRNDFQGHPTKMSMDESEYSNNRQVLEIALRQIASGINENAAIESLIKRTATGIIDSDHIFKHIKEIYDFKTSLLTAVEDMRERVNSKLSSIQGNQELILQKFTDLQNKHLRKTKHKYSRELEIIIHAECENEEKQRKANDLLFEFVEMIQRNTAIRSDEIRRIITQRVEWYGEIKLQLLDDLIKWFSDIEDLSDGVGKPRLGSIILPISCSSVTGILTLLKYMDNSQSKQHLLRISATVSELLGFPCTLSWKVEPMSLRSALSSSLLSPHGKGKRSKELRDLISPINITNTKQLTDILKMFGAEERNKNMEKISATLSDIFGETIRLKTYVDNDHLRSIVYERGHIESQPDNSTDDQSSVKEHKQQIQIKLRLSDYDEDLLSMTDVSEVHGISKEEEVHWVKSVLALKITAGEAMTYLARSIFKQFFNSLNLNEKMNLETLLDIAQNRHKDYKSRQVKDHRVWLVNSPECRSLLEKLVSAHWDPAYLEWDNIGDTNVERYWKIAKLYMPHGNKDSTCPEDTDMIAIFHMLRNFKVEDFAEERKEIDEMICHVNYLLRTPDNKISERKMSSILENIYQFMKSTGLSEGVKSKTKDKLQKVQLISNCDEWYKRILPKQKSDLAFERDRTNQFLNITEKLLVEFTNKTRFTIEPAYNEPLSDKIKGATAGRDIGAIGGPASLLYRSTLGATAGGASYLWKKSTVNPPNKSSEEEHKKSTQRRFRSPDSGEDLSEVRGISQEEEEEVNWVKSVLALKITADDAMTYLARSIFKQFFNSLNFSEKTNLNNLLHIAQNRHKDYKLTRVEDHRVWLVNSPECKSLLKKLVSAHWDPEYIGWENIGNVHVGSYWEIAKLYMPQGNKDSTCPEDTNMLAIFHLLRNFKVEDFVERRKEIDQMICHSKDLIVHSDDNRTSRTKMTEILENINKFMECTKLSYGIKSRTKDKLEKVQLISNSRKWYSYKRVIQKQRTGLAVEVDKTEEFLNITKMLLLVFKRENAMEREYGDRLTYMFSGALAGAATGAILGPAGIVIGCVTGGAIGALGGLEGLFGW